MKSKLSKYSLKKSKNSISDGFLDKDINITALLLMDFKYCGFAIPGRIRHTYRTIGT
jgi:hypothetical protein